MHDLQPPADPAVGIAQAPASGVSYEWPARCARMVRTFLGSFVGSGGVRVAPVRSGVLPPAQYRAIHEFQRAVETRYFGADPMTCEHGPDYTLLLRSVGLLRAFAATDRTGRVIGLMSLTRLRLDLPNGRVRRIAYIAHLRVLPECRAGLALPMLVARCGPHILFTGGIVAGLVRPSARFNPARVSRMLGLPAPRARATVRLLTFPTTTDAIDGAAPIREVTEREVRTRFRDLTRGCIASVGGDPSIRSAIAPRWIVAEDGSACGCIEDYHRAMHWCRPDGSEFRQSNISFFGWRDAPSAGRFVRACAHEAGRMGAERLRVLLDDRFAAPVMEHVGIAPTGDFQWDLTVGGLRRLPDAPWVLHPTEI